MRKTIFSLVKIFFCFAGVSAMTQGSRAADGWDFFPVYDGERRFCVDGESAKISLHLIRLVVERDRGWFKKDKSVVFTTEIGLLGSTGDDSEQLKHTVAGEYTLEGYDEGSVTMPVVEGLVTRFPLKAENRQTVSMDIEFRLYNIQGDGVAMKLLKKVSSLSETLPLPSNPYTSAFKKAAGFATGVFDSFEEESEDQLPMGNWSTEFSEGSSCTRTLAQAGTTVLLKLKPEDEGVGKFDFTNIVEPCLFADLANNDKRLYLGKREGGQCSYDKQSATVVHNSMMMFTLISQQSEKLYTTSEGGGAFGRVTTSELADRQTAALFGDVALSNGFVSVDTVSNLANVPVVLDSNVGSIDDTLVMPLFGADAANLRRCQWLGFTQEQCGVLIEPNRQLIVAPSIR